MVSYSNSLGSSIVVETEIAVFFRVFSCLFTAVFDIAFIIGKTLFGYGRAQIYERVSFSEPIFLCDVTPRKFFEPANTDDFMS